MSIQEVSDAGYPVRLASGAPFIVISPFEVDYVNERVKKYKDEFRYQNVSDLQDVDQIIIKELFCHRWSLWISKQVDYAGKEIDEQALRRSINDYSGELRQLKKSLGMDKVSRDKEHGDDSVANYLSNLRRRAKEFGINRNKMMDKGLELSQQAIALVQLWHNCTDDERIENQCTAEDICQWLWTVYKPEFEKVDKEFRQTNQKYWVSEL